MNNISMEELVNDILMKKLKRWWSLKKRIIFWDETLQRKACWYISAGVRRVK